MPPAAAGQTERMDLLEPGEGAVGGPAEEREGVGHYPGAGGTAVVEGVGGPEAVVGARQGQGRGGGAPKGEAGVDLPLAEPGKQRHSVSCCGASWCGVL